MRFLTGIECPEVAVARISETELARLKAEVSVARLVEGCGVEAARQGKDLVGRCPFHEGLEAGRVGNEDYLAAFAQAACRRGRLVGDG